MFEGCVRISCIVFRVFFWISIIKNLADLPSYRLVKYELFLKLFRSWGILKIPSTCSALPKQEYGTAESLAIFGLFGECHFPKGVGTVSLVLEAKWDRCKWSHFSIIAVIDCSANPMLLETASMQERWGMWYGICWWVSGIVWLCLCRNQRSEQAVKANP